MNTPLDFFTDVKKQKCRICHFIFFTHSKSRVDSQTCSVCDKENKNTKIVRNWERGN